MTSYVPRQAGDDVTRAVVGSPDFGNTTVTAYLHNLWAAQPNRTAFLGMLPKGLLQDLASMVAGPDGVAAFTSAVSAVPTRTVTRRAHLLTRDPGRDITMSTLGQGEVVADGYLAQPLTLGPVTIDAQGRTTASNAADIQFGPVTSGSVETVITVTHVALTVVTSDGQSRVLSVIEVAEPFALRVGESVAIKAGTLRVGVA
ncbi:hypothetical protein GCM10010331_45020 [Streptomyces xanthochromogenes]|uniref:hypothetical protein n=1 Tax=Streptomyces xanthochromogenes TaxID=67384 RepID=UPI001671930C|nr:hypothetical protein [Streptomyces xanthochromogenes]GHB52425.1 hypothetical protein GCM10010331_45020 [Streptomyces xanthochromogenes]